MNPFLERRMKPSGEVLLLLRFSEWLDSEGLMSPPTDERTHEELAREFLES